MTTSPRIGTNLSGIAYYSDELPFIDRMKAAGGWSATGATAPIPLDEHGYPTAIPTGATSVYLMVELDPLSAGTGDTYVLTYTGKADFALSYTKIVSSEPGKIVFQYTNPDSGQMLVAYDTIDPTAPLGNMHIVRQDQVDLFNAGAIFNPALTAKLLLLDTLRYMDWGVTNASTLANWADRPLPTDMTWGGAHGVPIEVMVALANETHTNMWLNVPTYASDDYVRQFLMLVCDSLNPSLSVHLEYSNEVWNFQFQQAGYAGAQGAKLWDTDANKDGKIDANDPAEHNGGDWVIWYGYRAAQIAAIAKEVFASQPTRLRMALATQTAWQGLENYIIDGVSRAGVGTIPDLFAEYAITTYFGIGDGSNATDKATILGWANGGDAGLTAGFAALDTATGLVAPDVSSLAFLAKSAAYHGGVAAKLGLELVAYEGGLDVSTIGGSDPTIGDFCRRMQADPRMGDAYAKMVATFAAGGGKLLNVLTDVNAGFYGTLKSVYDKGSPEWDALVAAEAAARSAQTPEPVPVPVPVSTAPLPTTVPAVPVSGKAALLELLDDLAAFVAKARTIVVADDAQAA